MGQNKLAIGLLASCLMVGAGATGAIADDSNPNLMYLANSAKIPLGGIQALKTLDMPVAIPIYVPADFYLERMELEFTDWGGVNYRLIYEGYDENTLARSCFAVEGTNDGIGGLPIGNVSHAVNSEIYGDSTIEEGYYGESEYSTLLGDWIGRGMGYYRFVGAGVYDSMAGCDNVSVNEAIAISESLHPLP
ncbi:hypothetical protein Lepto7376_0689 [[Leptolyngbya] sp. PCC 7376]|uniref:hypothetical protein n=1 Tax=[Leptolyngbya] sp. PCC 7376 TaxID=111781 RepID=UPI00029EFD9F|nr:hypothetical protein [[Leptolyngbya] sp. PCC 7376]AFY37089.1 hypothetical protein Lepto7376_0689 [[Leptolyngbya] sp. PCC 7376]